MIAEQAAIVTLAKDSVANCTEGPRVNPKRYYIKNILGTLKGAKRN
jgi:hypothetical protein